MVRKTGANANSNPTINQFHLLEKTVNSMITDGKLFKILTKCMPTTKMPFAKWEMCNLYFEVFPLETLGKMKSQLDQLALGGHSLNHLIRVVWADCLASVNCIEILPQLVILLAAALGCRVIPINVVTYWFHDGVNVCLVFLSSRYEAWDCWGGTK